MWHGRMWPWTAWRIARLLMQPHRIEAWEQLSKAVVPLGPSWDERDAARLGVEPGPKFKDKPPHPHPTDGRSGRRRGPSGKS